MFFILAIVDLATNATIHRCGHNELLKALKTDTILEKQRLSLQKTLKKSPRAVTNDSPFRIKVDYQYLDPAKDRLICTRVGQQITWLNRQYVCVEGDLLTDAKRKVVRETFDNVAKYLESLLKVKKSKPFKPSESDFMRITDEYPQPDIIVDTDMYLTIYARPFGQNSTTLASALAFGFDKINIRPNMGVVNVNFNSLPSESSNIDTAGDRSFFETALHEVIHALGFSYNLFPRFINRQTGYPYYDIKNVPIYYCRNSSYPNKIFTVLATPKLHEVAVNRYGSEYLFHQNCPAGAIIEDGGGSGTAGSHFDILQYLNELMVGMTVGLRNAISELSLAFLYDTGWYDVDFNLAEPLFYGDYRSYVGRTTPYTNFTTAPPQYVFPSNYLWNGDDSSQNFFSHCTYDHSAFGYFVPAQIDCSQYPKAKPCSIKEYVNPKNHKYYSADPLADYVTIFYPYSNRICHKLTSPVSGQVDYFKDSYGPGSYCVESVTVEGNQAPGLCYQMSCDSLNQLSVYVGNEKVVCPRANEQVTVNGITLTCPDPNNICGQLNYVSSPVDPDKPTDTPTEKPTDIPTEKPTEKPTVKPTEKPTEKPTVKPTEKPTEEIQTNEPTHKPIIENVNYYVVQNCQEYEKENQGNCISAENVETFSFKELDETITNLSIQILTQLTEEQMFQFSSIPHNISVEIKGIESTKSSIYFDLISIVTNINRLSFSNILLFFKSDEERKRLEVQQLHLGPNVSIKLKETQEKIDVNSVSILYFESLSYFDYFTFGNYPEIIVESDEFDSIRLIDDAVHLGIQGTTGMITEKIFEQGTNRMNLRTTQTRLSLNIENQSTRYITVSALSQTTTIIESQLIDEETHFGLEIANSLKLRCPFMNIPVDLTGQGEFEIEFTKDLSVSTIFKYSDYSYYSNHSHHSTNESDNSDNSNNSNNSEQLNYSLGNVHIIDNKLTVKVSKLVSKLHFESLSMSGTQPSFSTSTSTSSFISSTISISNSNSKSNKNNENKNIILNNQEKGDSDVDVEIPILTIQTKSHGIISSKVEIEKMIEIREKSQLLFQSTPTFKDGLSMKIEYSDKTNQKSPIISFPSNSSKHETKYGKIELSKGSSIQESNEEIKEKELLLQQIRIVFMTPKEYDGMTFSDLSGFYESTYLDEYLVAYSTTALNSNSISSRAITGIVIGIIVVVIVIVIVVVVVILFLIRKKKRDTSSIN
ncbi:hypothetical protein TRFO_25514 [Tritrichomonas foetus]|uniref:GP63-like n=1 Tax=Tritrichomonas foetus TaxID=1144522 RepID=A0A1J4K5N7_9EUKA|nr:hypothetical protein TRFO_25514 [Tritrichomonas foetus]|eukprot:OHT06483.1 hypothetical protein TRFO_25514 [Tritrichomonas foetus]